MYDTWFAMNITKNRISMSSHSSKSTSSKSNIQNGSNAVGTTDTSYVTKGGIDNSNYQSNANLEMASVSLAMDQSSQQKTGNHNFSNKLNESGLNAVLNVNLEHERTQNESDNLYVKSQKSYSEGGEEGLETRQESMPMLQMEGKQKSTNLDAVSMNAAQNDVAEPAFAQAKSIHLDTLTEKGE